MTLSRRDFVFGTILGVAFSDAVLAEMTTPRVYRDYTLEELDRALDQTLHAPEWRDLLKVYEQKSAAAWERLKPEEHAFGPYPEEKLDFYPVKNQEAPPLVLLFHGGGWRMMGRRDVAYAAPAFLEQGVAFAAPSYGLLPDTSIRTMADRCRRSVIWAHRNAERLGIDSRRIHVGGLSAGAHLAGNLLTTDWEDFGLPHHAVAGGILVSGIYDVAALAASTVYGYTALNDEDISVLSPIRRVENINAKTLVAWGEHEPPEFARQSRHFLAELQRKGKQVSGLRVTARNHFEIALDLGDPSSALFRAAMDLIAAR